MAERAARTRLRRTKIVATLGPATDDLAVLTQVLQAGVDVVRLNVSHGTLEDRRQRLALVREAVQASGRYVGILVDLSGPKIRIDRFREGRVLLEDGACFTLDTSLDPEAGTVGEVGIAYKNLPRDVSPGDMLLLDRRADHPRRREGRRDRASRRACSSAASSPTARASTARAAASPPARSPTRTARTFASPPSRASTISRCPSRAMPPTCRRRARCCVRPAVRRTWSRRSSAPRRSRISRDRRASDA